MDSASHPGRIVWIRLRWAMSGEEIRSEHESGLFQLGPDDESLADFLFDLDNGDIPGVPRDHRVTGHYVLMHAGEALSAIHEALPANKDQTELTIYFHPGKSIIR